MHFNKPALSIQEQINLLQDRGLHIPDHKRTTHYLTYISYYRLSAYMLPYQIPHDNKHRFIKGSSFNDILNLYLFDRELRLLVLDAIERIEIAFRTQIINQYSLHHGPYWYENPSLYIKRHHCDNSLSIIDEEIARSAEVFIKHYKSKYTSPARPPAWMAMEVSSVGLLSKVYKNLKMSPVKKGVAHKFQLGHPYVLESWMESFCYVRNICAHHSRLWNRTLTIKPMIPNHTLHPWLTNPDFDKNKLYLFLSSLLYMLKIVSPKTHFAAKFKQLLIDFPNVNERKMGFSKTWRNEKLWN